jgi:hypothetical protein
MMSVDAASYVSGAYKDFRTLLGKDSGKNDSSRWYIKRDTTHLCIDPWPGKTTEYERFKLSKMSERVDPLFLLTCPEGPSTDELLSGRKGLLPPYVALLVGQYGTGKSEFAHQLAEVLEQASGPTSFRPLPVSLARCRQYKHLLRSEPKAEDFAALLLGGPHNSGDGPLALAAEIRDHVRRGSLLLILDGLDELAEDATEHKYFFCGLRRFLLGDECATRPADARFRTLVTMRREYLTAVDTPHGTDLLSLLNPGKPLVPVHLFEMGHFQDAEVEEYLRRRLNASDALLEKLVQRDELFNTLRRPLLLNVFSELAARLDVGKLLDSAATAAGLIEMYINMAHDAAEDNQKELGSWYIWDRDALAERCLKLYEEGAQTLTSAEDQVAILHPRCSGPVPPEEIFLSIHKCPFLIRDQDAIRFAHRVFFEYFTAMGVAQQVKEGNINEAFGKLVLNSDMRKFLRFMVDKANPEDKRYFFKLTKRSWGLEDPQQWPMGEHNFRELQLSEESDLNLAQEWLINGMTEPERDQAEVEKRLRWFLSHQDIGFHPDYLKYGYHAAATYLYERRWRSEWVQLRRLFSDILRARLDEALVVLNGPPCEPLTLAWQHLVERILDIGLSFRFEWVQGYVRRTRERLALDWDEKSKKRTLVTLNNIEQSIF